MAVQYFFVWLTLAACVAYVVWRIVRAFRMKSGDGCHGCTLKDKCVKRRPITKKACHERCHGKPDM